MKTETSVFFLTTKRHSDNKEETKHSTAPVECINHFILLTTS